jgi:hypothetical protein
MLRSLAHSVRGGVVALTLSLPSLGSAQQTPGTISGIVRDVAERPMSDIEVFVFPSSRQTRSDGAGRFSLSGIEPGRYVVRARRVGLQPVSVSVLVPAGGSVDVELTFARILPTLDTVVVKGTPDCPKHNLTGFMCRRSSAKGGVFLDYNDIASKNAEFIGDLYRGIEGFRVDWSGTPRGIIPRPVPISGWRCMKTLINGWTPMLFNRAPEVPADIMAMEIYADPDDVPPEFQGYTWPAQDYRTTAGRSRGRTRGRNAPISPSGRCSLTVYWTYSGYKRP